MLNRSIEEGTFMVNHRGEVLNSKTEWNQPRLIRTTILQGGAEMIRGRVLLFQRAGGAGAGSGATGHSQRVGGAGASTGATGPSLREGGARVGSGATGPIHHRVQEL